ncbi:MAG: hypothetical protein V1875_00800 [Candidatus Altiarchaeota archaeon]
MNSDDLFLQCLDREKSIEGGLLQEYTKYYSSLKDDNLRLMMKEIFLLGITQMKVANEMIRYMQERKPGTAGVPSSSYAQSISLPDEITGFTPPDSMIVEVSPWDYGSFVAKSMRHLVTDRGLSCVYVSVTKPLVVIKDMMIQAGADMSRISFIECSSLQESKDAVSPESLEELNYRIDSLLDRMGDCGRFVVIDTISALRVYNAEPIILDFVNITNKRAKIRGYGLMLLDIPSENDPINPVMRTFVDKVVTA